MALSIGIVGLPNVGKYTLFNALTKAPFYYTSVAPKPRCYKSGTFYFYDGILVNNRYRITNTAARCGKLPVGKNVTGWVPASYCNGGGITTK